MAIRDPTEKLMTELISFIDAVRADQLYTKGKDTVYTIRAVELRQRYEAWLKEQIEKLPS